jgi:Kef-type K+ transport system membrane component KefB
VLGLSSIIGAFIAGTSLGGITFRHGRDLHRGSESITAVFASIFFVSLGILSDVRSLDFRVILFLLAIAVVAVVSKVVGCGGSALLTRSSLRESAIIGFGMSPRGEVAMIIALIGLDRKLIGQDVYVSIIVMSLLTTILTPLILRNWLFRTERKSTDAMRESTS